jgi:hypothetical protein
MNILECKFARMSLQIPTAVIKKVTILEYKFSVVSLAFEVIEIKK